MTQNGNSPRPSPRRLWKALLFGGLALASAGVWVAYERDISAARKAAAEGGQVALTAAGPIEYGVAGNGVPALVIHGAGGGYDQGLYLGEMLGPGFKVIAPSRFGYLRTPVPPDGSPPAQADAHAALLDTLNVDRAVVVGVSAGGPSAIELALRHPERVSALILVVALAYEPDSIPGLQESPSNKVMLNIVLRGADFAYWAMSHTARSVLVRFLGVPPELEQTAPDDARAAVTRVMKIIQPLSQRLAGMNNDGTVRLKPWPLERITCPTLIITSKDDLYNTLPATRFTAARIPGTKLIVFDSGGHLLVNRSEQVQAAIAEFIAAAGVTEAALRSDKPNSGMRVRIGAEETRRR